MSPGIASIIYLSGIIWLFRQESKRSLGGSDIWIPVCWFLIISTRPVSTWLEMFGVRVGGVSLEEGSIVDAAVFLALIILAFRRLMNRRVSIGLTIRENAMLVLFLAYCLMAVGWSDYPVVSLKRWLKNLGHPTMVLLLLSHGNPRLAIEAFFKRCTYIIAPLSILFIKYFPEWGRGFNMWNGLGYNRGIADGKNQLGNDCLILGFFYIWHLFTLKSRPVQSDRREFMLGAAMLAMIAWLLSTADSKTPVVALAVALVILLFTCLPIDRRKMGAYLLVSGIAIITIQSLTDIYGTTLELLGRDKSLTERVPLWLELRKWGDQNPILGTGFESFWLGERREQIWAILDWPANHAHNGYLETYLNLGLVGLGLLAALLLATYRKINIDFASGGALAQLRFPFFFALLVYNWTEASFHGLSPIFFMLFLLCVEFRSSSHPCVTDNEILVEPEQQPAHS